MGNGEKATCGLPADDAAVKTFWKTGADELSVHFTDKAKKAAGGWLITIALGAGAVRLVVWLVQSGAIK